ncbi:hypothetical protein [Hellea balneolensis]|uniref:hypothetical protein n=1 Tax=Hellea balneolensis TaxID=287478 RepID=UPI0003FD72CE|nr:hypothetical protein [Hellea balneolensis]
MVNISAHSLKTERRNISDAPYSVLGIKLSALEIGLCFSITLILSLQLYLQFIQKINWDEFFYLSHIYEAQNGQLDKTLQMAHIYLFGWITKIPGGEMVQITVGRFFMWAAQIGTLILIFKIAAKFMPRPYALFAVLSFLGIGFIYVHGTSFRADPIAALCIIYAVYVFIVSDLKSRDLAGLAIALALGAFITIKIILFAPLLAALALRRLIMSSRPSVLFIRFGLTVIASAILFAALLWGHSLTLAAGETADNAASLSSTAETVFLSGGLFPRLAVIKTGFITGLIPSILIFSGLVMAILSVAADKQKRKEALVILSMALPLLTFTFYSNAYPYFYAFILPPVVILAGYGAFRLKLSSFMLAALSVLIMANIVFLHITRIDDMRRVQAQTLSAVHKMFPEPVSYFDRNGMVASFPKAGLFMSSWGLRNYRRAAQPIFLNEMQNKTVPLLIDNSPAISAALGGETSTLLPEDAAALRENYIPHWGQIWVAGKQLSLDIETTEFSILIPGEYTLESADNVWLNGDLLKIGNVITLERGVHSLRSAVPQEITLRWGTALPRPPQKALSGPIFGAF